MAVKVKICGVRTPAVIEAAADEGADYVGLVLFTKSPRYVEIEEARVLAAIAKGKLGTVAVLVDPDDALIDEVAERVRPDILQLHGNETPERVAAIKARASLPAMKAIAISDADDVAKAGVYAGVADYMLFDAKAAPGATIPGGNGVAFDWRVLQSIKAPFALSGGLTADSVGEAVRLTGASLVDVSSGVERSPGEKDVNLVRRFIQAAKSAAPQDKG
ncbi:MAG TPA: phosphoribosylanthranilate isomerase [Methyloceanibacter sp.]|nr:phosphoribosylanthranilate isomerase [Methyloceanibacter sp.]